MAITMLFHILLLIFLNVIHNYFFARTQFLAGTRRVDG